MTQQEFTNRTLVEVSAEEFNAIHVVYMASDLDKDEFCKVWCKMNRTRVQAAKEAKKAQQERYNRCTKLMAIKQKLMMMMEQDKWSGNEWIVGLKSEQLNTIESEGIGFSEFGHLKSVSSLWYDIREKINEIASIA